VLGGALVAAHTSSVLLGFDLPLVDTGIDTATEAALCVVMGLYLLATVFNLYIPDTGAKYAPPERNPIKLIADFAECSSTLWKDKLGQISLAVTTLFWGAGATLQLIVLVGRKVGHVRKSHQPGRRGRDRHRAKRRRPRSSRSRSR
jgi:hypothetical protein